jgi:hypothetical protein
MVIGIPSTFGAVYKAIILVVVLIAAAVQVMP